MISKNKLRELKEELKGSGVTLERMAALAGVSRATLNEVLKGTNPRRLDVVEKLIELRNAKRAELKAQAQKLEAAI